MKPINKTWLSVVGTGCVFAVLAGVLATAWPACVGVALFVAAEFAAPEASETADENNQLHLATE